MKKRLEKVPMPESARLRRLLAERADEILEGARLVDVDAGGATGIDLILTDEAGRPVFVDVVSSVPRAIPVIALEHRRWYEDNRRLFQRAYAREGVVKAEDPVFVFVARDFPEAVVEAVGSMAGVVVKLLRAECYAVDGEIEILLDEVTRVRREPDASSEVAGPGVRGSETGPGERIESPSVRQLFALFMSGVDGLDGGIEVLEEGDRVRFALDGRVLAETSVSPGSFTVSPGDSLVNPIVVSDRVSLERALNAVVSLFVREEKPALSRGGTELDLSEEERAQLASVWGAGVPTKS
jgi:hypothetical protein